MSAEWDLTTYNQDNQLTLIVEVKNRLNASPEWAAQLRRNIFAHGTFPNAPYFLMVFPDRFYLWTDPTTDNGLVKPDYIIDAVPILESYFERAGVTAEEVSSQSLELIVASWLSELIYETSDELDLSQTWLIDSGLYQAIAGGRLEHGVLV